MNHKKIEERLKELYEQKTTIEKEIETLEAIVNQKEKRVYQKMKR